MTNYVTLLLSCANYTKIATVCAHILQAPFYILSTDFFFKKKKFSKYSFKNTIRVSNSLDQDQDRHSVGPDLDPNCLQRLSTYHHADMQQKSWLARKEITGVYPVQKYFTARFGTVPPLARFPSSKST